MSPEETAKILRDCLVERFSPLVETESLPPSDFHQVMKFEMLRVLVQQNMHRSERFSETLDRLGKFVVPLEYVHCATVGFDVEKMKARQSFSGSREQLLKDLARDEVVVDDGAKTSGTEFLSAYPDLAEKLVWCSRSDLGGDLFDCLCHVLMNSETSLSVLSSMASPLCISRRSDGSLVVSTWMTYRSVYVSPVDETQSFALIHCKVSSSLRYASGATGAGGQLLQPQKETTIEFELTDPSSPLSREQRNVLRMACLRELWKSSR